MRNRCKIDPTFLHFSEMLNETNFIVVFCFRNHLFICTFFFLQNGGKICFCIFIAHVVVIFGKLCIQGAELNASSDCLIERQKDMLAYYMFVKIAYACQMPVLRPTVSY